MSRIKPVFKCHEKYKQDFHQAKCLLTISVGQEVHEDERFSSTVELVNNSFASCIVFIDDSLQRHTMALNSEKGAEDFYEYSVKEGDSWLKRNNHVVNSISIPKTIMRWEYVLKHEKFEETKNKILAEQERDPEYRAAFVDTVDEFLSRYHRRLLNQSDFDIERGKELCFNYLVEECVAMCLWQDLLCNYEVYPSRRNLAMSETHRRFVYPNNPNLLNEVSIKFKNRKQLKPQNLGTLVLES